MPYVYPRQRVKNAKELGLNPGAYKAEPWMRQGFIDGNNSGSAALDYAETHYLFKAVEHYFPGSGFSVGFVSPAGDKCQMGT